MAKVVCNVRFLELNNVIDNIFSTELYNNESAIIVNNISDHQMISAYSRNTDKTNSTSSKKFMEIEKN